MLGMHGLKSANHAVQARDLLICVGARFDDRVTGLLVQFAPEARVIHLDVIFSGVIFSGGITFRHHAFLM